MQSVPDRALERNNFLTPKEQDLRRNLTRVGWKKIALAAWQAPSWREAAIAYHEIRDDRRAAVEIDPARLKRLRRLMPREVSLERAYHEIISDRIRGRTSEAVVEALMFSLRAGINELTRPDTQRRLSELNNDKLEAVCLRVQAFEPNVAPAWSADDADLLISAWRKFREQR